MWYRLSLGMLHYPCVELAASSSQYFRSMTYEMALSLLYPYKCHIMLAVLSRTYHFHDHRIADQ